MDEKVFYHYKSLLVNEMIFFLWPERVYFEVFEFLAELLASVCNRFVLCVHFEVFLWITLSIEV